MVKQMVLHETKSTPEGFIGSSHCFVKFFGRLKCLNNEKSGDACKLDSHEISRKKDVSSSSDMSRQLVTRLRSSHGLESIPSHLSSPDSKSISYMGDMQL